MNRKQQTENTEPKLNWVRTGKKLQEMSHNGKGYIILEEEKANGKTRLVATTYTSIIRKKKED